MKRSKGIAERAARIRLVILDVDGVLTDGGIYYSADGAEMKRFHAHDGYGVVLAREHGLKLAIVSGRSTPIVAARARELKIRDVFQGAVDKVAAMKKICRKHSLDASEVAFMGDDLFDLPLLKSVGLSAAPSNAQPGVKRAVDIITQASGGNGAVREFLEFITGHQAK